MECIKANAVLLGNRVVVLDVKEGHDLYFRGGFYGRFFTVPKPKLPDVEKELEISLFDAMYLLEQGCLNLTNERGEPIKPSEFFSIASKLYDNFYDAYTVYKDLRNRGYVVKSGMKFGSTFAVYQFGPGLSASESLGRYSVNVAVALPDTLCNIKDYTFKIIPPQDGYVNENTVYLGENTTLTVRFFSGGISIGDLIIYSPPPSLLVQPPIYSLEIRFLDLMGYPVNNTSFIIYSRGIPVYRGFTPSGKAVVCPLPKGSYDIVAYLSSVAIGKGKVDVFSDQSMDVRTNTSTVRFQFVRQGTGEILKDYTAILRGYVTMRTNSSMDGIVVYHGVPPGNYKLDVLWNGTLLATYDVSIDLSSADKVLSIQAYKLQVLVRNLLDQPVKNIQVLLEGRDFSKSRLTDEMGRVDFGFVPAGNYTLIVEQALPQKLEVSQDTFKVVQIDEVAKIYGFTITGKILSLAVGLIFVFTMIWLIAKIVKRFIHRGKGIEEV